MKKTKFKELRKLMYGEGIDQETLGEYLGKGTTYISMRIRGISPWSLADVYRLCELFQIAPEQIPVYFPKEDTCKA